MTAIIQCTEQHCSQREEKLVYVREKNIIGNEYLIIAKSMTLFCGLK
jgi:hypothetical protein